MRVKISVEALRSSDDLHDASHRAEVYPADDPGAAPLMVTGWNWCCRAASAAPIPVGADERSRRRKSTVCGGPALMPANILNLPQYRVLRVEESDHDYHVTAEPVDVTAACPHCQSDRLNSWGTREQVFKDLPMHGKRVGIYIDTKRLRCQACGKTFSQALPLLAENRMMTDW